MATMKDKIHLSPCARDYALCVSNPFSGPLACIPDFPAIKTRRVRVFNRGQFATSSTTGIGFICVTPEFAVANDSISGFSTDSTFATLLVSPNSATTGVSAIKSNADYTSAQFGATPALIQRRVVGSGLRVRYAGTELGRGGQLYALQEPTHDNLNTTSITTMLAQDQARKFPMSSKEWLTVLYKPVGTNQFQTTAPSVATDQTAVANSNYIAVIAQAPTATSSIVLEYEFYTVYEATGQIVRGIVNSHVDVAGYSAVHTTQSNGKIGVPTQAPAQKIQESFFQEVGEYLLKGLTWVGDHASEIALVAETVVAFL